MHSFVQRRRTAYVACHMQLICRLPAAQGVDTSVGEEPLFRVLRTALRIADEGGSGACKLALLAVVHRTGQQW
jgi:hypothetical protein